MGFLAKVEIVKIEIEFVLCNIKIYLHCQENVDST